MLTSFRNFFYEFEVFWQPLKIPLELLVIVMNDWASTGSFPNSTGISVTSSWFSQFTYNKLVGKQKSESTLTILIVFLNTHHKPRSSVTNTKQ